MYPHVADLPEEFADGERSASPSSRLMDDLLSPLRDFQRCHRPVTICRSGGRTVIRFIVSGPSRVHNFSMNQGPEDDLLPWVVGGILLIAMTIAVAAVAGSGGEQAAPVPAAAETLDLPTKG